MTNFLAGQNTGFEGGKGHWASSGSCTATDSSAAAHTGADSLAITSTSAGTSGAASCSVANITTQGMPVSPGDLVYVSTWFLAATQARSCTISAVFYNASGVLVSPLAAQTASDKTSAWSFMDGTVAAPAASAFCRVLFQAISTANTEVHYIDDVVLARSTGGGAYISRFLLDLFDEAGT